MTSRTYVPALAVGAAALALAGLAGAQGLPKPSHDYKAAPAGDYVIDPHHTGVVARAPHLGFSYSIFRFETVSGELVWNPANPAADKLNVTVNPASIQTAPVPGFSQEIDERFLKTAQFPTATFVSTAFHPEGPTRGRVEGDLTLIGVTRHVTFDVDLVGAGKVFKSAVIGIHAHTELDPKIYSLPPFITGPIQLNIDTEFDQKPG